MRDNYKFHIPWYNTWYYAQTGVKYLTSHLWGCTFPDHAFGRIPILEHNTANCWKWRLAPVSWYSSRRLYSAHLWPFSKDKTVTGKKKDRKWGLCSLTKKKRMRERKKETDFKQYSGKKKFWPLLFLCQMAINLWPVISYIRNV